MEIIRVKADPQAVSAFQRRWCLITDPNKEDYISPDGLKKLELTFVREPAWSGALFKAALMERATGKRRLLDGIFESCGQGGAQRTVFSGNPFSPDSSFVALIQAQDGGSAASLGCWSTSETVSRLGMRRGLKQELSVEVEKPALFHSWSHDSRYCLVQETARWIVINCLETLPVGTIESPGDGFPAHGAFLRTGELILFSESKKKIAVFRAGMWKSPYIEQPVDLESPIHSFPDPSGNGLIVGTAARLGRTVEAREWHCLGLRS